MPRAHPATVKQLALTLMLQGFALPTIAEKLNLPEGCVKTWSRRGQWSLIKAQIQADASRAAVVVATQANSDASKRIRSDLALEIQEQVEALRRKPVRTAAELANSQGQQGRAAVVKTLIEAASTVHGWGDEAKAGLIVPMIGREPAIEISAPGPDQVPGPVSDAVPDPVQVEQDKPSL